MSEFIAPVCTEQIALLYQDNDILLINKPSGLLSLSGKNPLNKDSVHFRLVQDLPTATLLHRLDFGTSGIMLVALNKQVNGLLTKQFQDRTITKTYTAVLDGHLADNEGDIQLPIAKDVDHFPLMKICHELGKPAHSHYQVIERTGIINNNQNDRNNHDTRLLTTRVLFKPITGRTHQLRIHSQQIGHPILGCDLYHNEYSTQLAPRLLLHASTLSFTHPITGLEVNGICDCPF